MDVASRRVLYKKNPHVKLPMASTTKIMTAILAIEMGDLADVVTVSPPGGRSRGFVYYLERGEKLTLEDCCTGLCCAPGMMPPWPLPSILAER
jgi:D-alanyl-D-alanine carboxypeptidase (penicillin-binding protein 5/6)